MARDSIDCAQVIISRSAFSFLAVTIPVACLKKHVIWLSGWSGEKLSGGGGGGGGGGRDSEKTPHRSMESKMT